MATSLPKGAVKPRGIQGNKVGGKTVSPTGGKKSSAYMPTGKKLNTVGGKVTSGGKAR